MMFHRESGGLKEELREMKDCMPHYYRITDGHGQGAELVMEAEGKFLQGDFLAYRLSVFTDLKLHNTFEERRESL